VLFAKILPVLLVVIPASIWPYVFIVPQSQGAVMFLLSSGSEGMFSRSLTMFITLLLTFLSGPVSFLKHNGKLWDTVLTAVSFCCTVE